MPWLHTSGNIQMEKPARYRKADGMTVTSELVTDEMIAEMGWTYIDQLPASYQDVVTETTSTATIYLVD